jgi:predicted regulator of Ras-like GTPase activity (Roadblock/LC7/MglB family)
MGRSKANKSIDKFQAAVDYLIEYEGVRGVAIADSEGLVVAKRDSGSFDAEVFCAIALKMTDSLDSILPRLVEPGIEYLALKTAHDWVTIARSDQFLLVVAADRGANDLLNIRIIRALEMISSHLKNKYRKAFSAGSSAVNKKNTEAVNV